MGRILATIPPAELVSFIKEYMSREVVDEIVVGLPTTMRGEPSDSMRYITPAMGRLRKEFPGMKFTMWDERFTSTLAHRAMLDARRVTGATREPSTAWRQ